MDKKIAGLLGAAAALTAVGALTPPPRAPSTLPPRQVTETFLVPFRAPSNC